MPFSPCLSFVSKPSPVSPTTGGGCHSSGHMPSSVPLHIYSFFSPLPRSVISLSPASLAARQAFISGVGSMVSISKLCFPPWSSHTGFQDRCPLFMTVILWPQFALLKQNDLIFSLMTWPHFFPWTVLHDGWQYLRFPFCPRDMLQAVRFPMCWVRKHRPCVSTT